MNWTEILSSEEEMAWQGRPAPRCFTFRNWQHSIFGVIILVASIFWLAYGLKLGNDYQQAVYGLIPVPFLLGGAYLAFGHLILARLEWENVFYAMTDRRLIVVRGLLRRRIETASLDEVIWFQLSLSGEELGTVRIRFRDLERKISISCIEYPRKLTDLLEVTLKSNGIDLHRGTEG